MHLHSLQQYIFDFAKFILSCIGGGELWTQDLSSQKQDLKKSTFNIWLLDIFNLMDASE